MQLDILVLGPPQYSYAQSLILVFVSPIFELRILSKVANKINQFFTLTPPLFLSTTSTVRSTCAVPRRTGTNFTVAGCLTTTVSITLTYTEYDGETVTDLILSNLQPRPQQQGSCT